MTEVVISRKSLFIGLLVLALLILASLGFLFLQRFLPGVAVSLQPALSASTASPDEDQVAREAALTGAQAFYTVDYRDQQTWMDKLCAVSTQIGCAVDRNALAPGLWDGFVEHQTITSVKVSSVEKVMEQILPARGGAQAQAWRLQIELSAPWPQQTQPLTSFEALALVIQEQGVWKFERFLSEDEALQYAKGK